MAGIFFYSLNRTPNDDFTGENGSAPESYRWDILYGAHNYTYDPEIQSNQLRIRVDSVANDLCGVASKFILVGDLDMQLDFSADEPAANLSVVNFHIRDVSEAGDQARIQYVSRNGATDYYASRILGTGDVGIDTAIVEINPGKMRITRTGSNVTMYYYDSGWVSIETYSWKSVNVHVDIVFSNGSTWPAGSALCDNFTVNSESIIWT
jgi:hypothetical protein